MKNLFYVCGLVLAFVGLFIDGGKVFAKQEVIEASGSYVMDMQLDETAANATARAREEAKRAAVEKAGVYLQAYSKTVDLALDYDEVRTVAAQLLKIQGEKRKTNIIDENLLEIVVTIEALVDDNNGEVLKAMMQDKQSLEESTRKYQELQKEYAELKRQMDEIKQRYTAPNAEQRRELVKAVAQNTEHFNAMQEWEAGNNFYRQGEYRKALEAYTRAADLNQTSAEIFNNRGNTYVALGQYQSALNDLQRANSLLKDDARIHNNLGSVYLLLKRYDSAVAECTAAIRLNPNFAEAYYNRGLAYAYLGRYRDALPDAKRALELNPTDADSQDLYNKINSRVSG